MNRAERRRQAKAVANGSLVIDTSPRPQLVATHYVNPRTGKRYKTIDEYLEAMEAETAQQCSDICAQMLCETEDYIAMANILIFLYAIKATVGNLKTVQKSYQKILEAYNEASEYVDRIGLKQAYEDFKAEYGINFEFYESDIGMIFDSEEIHRRLKLKIGG